jgi:tetratricopeptide (TPR) repeat protein
MPKPKRITRRDLRKNELAEALQKAVRYVRHNVRTVQIGIGIVAVTVLIITGISFFVKKAVQQKEREFVQALVLFHYPGKEDAQRYKDAKDAFSRFLSKYKKGRLSKLALFYKGLSEKGLSEYGSAEKSFESFISQYSKDRIVTSCLVNLGNIYEEKGEYRKAIEAYEKVVNLDDFLSGYAKFRISRCYEKLGERKMAEKLRYELAQISSPWIKKEFSLGTSTF